MVGARWVVDQSGCPIRPGSWRHTPMLTPATEAATLNAIPMQVWTATPEGPLDFVNQFACDYFGVDAARLLGEGWQHLVHPADLLEVAQCWGNSLSTGVPYSVEFRLLRAADKQFRWHHAQAIPLRDADGSIRKWVGTNQDIDASKRAEEIHTAAMARVRQERELVRRLFAQTPVALSVHLGPEHRVEQLSQKAQELLGRRTVEGLTAREAFPELAGQGVFEQLDRVFATGEAWTGREVALHLRRGAEDELEEASFGLTCQPLHDDHGATYGVINVFTEITEGPTS